MGEKISKYISSCSKNKKISFPIYLLFIKRIGTLFKTIITFFFNFSLKTAREFKYTSTENICLFLSIYYNNIIYYTEIMFIAKILSLCFENKIFIFAEVII